MFSLYGRLGSSSRAIKELQVKRGELSQERAPHIHSREQKLCLVFKSPFCWLGVCCSPDLQGLEGGKAGFIRPGPSCRTITLSTTTMPMPMPMLLPLRINSKRDLFPPKVYDQLKAFCNHLHPPLHISNPTKSSLNVRAT